jgi:hypothetical protein
VQVLVGIQVLEPSTVDFGFLNRVQHLCNPGKFYDLRSVKCIHLHVFIFRINFDFGTTP